MAITEFSSVTVLIFLGLATLSTGEHAFVQDKIPALPRRLPSAFCHLRCAKFSNKVRQTVLVKNKTVALVSIRVKRSTLSNNSHLSTAVVSSLDIVSSTRETYQWFDLVYNLISLNLFVFTSRHFPYKIWNTKKHTRKKNVQNIPTLLAWLGDIKFCSLSCLQTNRMF